MTSDADYGHVVSSNEAMLFETPNQQENSTSGVILDPASSLWEYHNQGTLHGVPVADNAVGLPIDKESLLDVALTLKRTPRSKIFWMSPEDEESIKLYDKLLAAQSENQLVIIDELKQYDASKCKFMVWLRYDELLYELNPRFEYLREELNNG